MKLLFQGEFGAAQQRADLVCVHAKGCADFDIRQTGMPQRQGGRMPLADPSQRRADAVAHLGIRDRSGRVRRRRDGARCGDGVRHFAMPAPFAGSKLIQRRMDRGHVKPARGVNGVRPMKPVKRDEDILRYVFSRVHIEENASRDRDDSFVFAVEESLERGALPFVCKVRFQP